MFILLGGAMDFFAAAASGPVNVFLVSQTMKKSGVPVRTWKRIESLFPKKK